MTEIGYNDEAELNKKVEYFRKIKEESGRKSDYFSQQDVAAADAVCKILIATQDGKQKATIELKGAIYLDLGSHGSLDPESTLWGILQWLETCGLDSSKLTWKIDPPADIICLSYEN